MELFAGVFALGFVLLLLVGFGIWLWALIDAIQVPDDAMYRTGNKLVWVIVIVFVPILVGPILYFAVGRPESGST